MKNTLVHNVSFLLLLALMVGGFGSSVYFLLGNKDSRDASLISQQTFVGLEPLAKQKPLARQEQLARQDPLARQKHLARQKPLARQNPSPTKSIANSGVTNTPLHSDDHNFDVDSDVNSNVNTVAIEPLDTSLNKSLNASQNTSSKQISEASSIFDTPTSMASIATQPIKDAMAGEDVKAIVQESTQTSTTSSFNEDDLIDKLHGQAMGDVEVNNSVAKFIPKEDPEASPKARLSFQDHLAIQAELRLQSDVTYDGRYLKIAYPMGDVPKDMGVCTDVVIRSFRGLGIDLQQRVHEDMKKSFRSYPKKWGLKKPDTNIDHRRVPNLMTYFERKGTSLGISNDPLDYYAGDIVTWNLDNGMVHIGIVSNYLSENTNNPLIIHNIGAGPQMNDMLFDFEITGHYKYGNLTDRDLKDSHLKQVKLASDKTF